MISNDCCCYRCHCCCCWSSCCCCCIVIYQLLSLGRELRGLEEGKMEIRGKGLMGFSKLLWQLLTHNHKYIILLIFLKLLLLWSTAASPSSSPSSSSSSSSFSSLLPSLLWSSSLPLSSPLLRYLFAYLSTVKARTGFFVWNKKKIFIFFSFFLETKIVQQKRKNNKQL